jgi:hypothetical protein
LSTTNFVYEAKRLRKRIVGSCVVIATGALKLDGGNRVNRMFLRTDVREKYLLVEKLQCLLAGPSLLLA